MYKGTTQLIAATAGVNQLKYCDKGIRIFRIGSPQRRRLLRRRVQKTFTAKSILYEWDKAGWELKISTSNTRDIDPFEMQFYLYLFLQIETVIG